MNKEERINRINEILEPRINGKTIEEYVNEKIEYCKKNPFEVLAERVKGDEIYVLGKHSKNYGLGYKKFYRKIVLGKEDGEIIVNDSFKADEGALIFGRRKMGKAKKLLADAEEFEKLNLADLENLLQDDVHIYQLGVEAFEKQFEKVKVIEVKGVKNILRADNDLQIRVKAFLLGADAILHYDESTCSGTPVAFVEKHKKNELYGLVTTGIDKGKYYVGLDDYQKQFKEKLSFEAYPGTLNLKVDKKEALDFLDQLESIEIDGFSIKEKIYHSLKCYKVKIDDVDGAIVVPEKTRYGEEIIEIIAPVNLRDKLRLKDNDKLRLSYE